VECIEGGTCGRQDEGVTVLEVVQTARVGTGSM
jgi:hypothetical protein